MEGPRGGGAGQVPRQRPPRSPTPFRCRLGDDLGRIGVQKQKNARSAFMGGQDQL